MKVTENKQISYDLTGLSQEEAEGLVCALAHLVSEGTKYHSPLTIMSCKAVRDELQEFIH